jgi:hypothetical protein
MKYFRCFKELNERAQIIDHVQTGVQIIDRVRVIMMFKKVLTKKAAMWPFASYLP